MSLSRAEVIAYLEGLSSLALGELIDGLQQRLGIAVSPAPPVFTVTGAPLTSDDPEPVHRVRISAVGPRRVRVLQALRERMPLALQDSLHLLESPPVVVTTGLSQADTCALIDELRAAGATAELA